MDQGKYENTMCKISLGHNQGKADITLGLFLDSLTTNFPNQVAINEINKDSLKKRSIHKMDAGVLPLPPQEQRLLPHQRPVQSNQKPKQKQISKGSYDQERRHPRTDPIHGPYTHMLPILINVGVIVPKEIEHSRFQYHHKYEPRIACFSKPKFKSSLIKS